MAGKNAVFAGALLLAITLSLTLTADLAFARRLARPLAAGAAAGVVNLPYAINDNLGNQWIFYQSGQFQQQGDMPIYGQGGLLQINGAFPELANEQARIDEKTGELVMEHMQVGNGLILTRRILISPDEGWIRYIDLLKNPAPQEQTINLAYSANINFGIQWSSTIADPKNRNQNIAWVAQTHAQGRTILEMYGGKGAKIVPAIQNQPHNGGLSATFAPAIPSGREIAIMHFHMVTTSVDAAQRFIHDMKESRMMADLPSAVRKLIINFRQAENFIGDHEILRGDILDVVELRTGDQLKGTLREKAFSLQTFYGAIELPVEKVVGIVNAGEFRPRQLLITEEGEIFGGRLGRDRLALELSSGQLTEIPLAQISRMGYRRRAGEPDEWLFEKPMVLMSAGDRIGVRMPEGPIDVVTRYGTLSLSPQSISAINFQTDDHGVHEIILSDGSRFAGLVSAQSFEMKLAGPGDDQPVRFPAAALRRLQLQKMEEPAPDQALMTLANDEQFVGSLAGTLQLDTAFSTITLNAGEIKRLAHTSGSPTDVQVVLWDDSTVSGQLQAQTVACKLKSGLTMEVPVALIVEYVQPRPTPSAAVIERIKSLVTELNADDWKQRDRAQEGLSAMGPVVITTLREMRPTQPPEGQQRIDVVLKHLAAQEARQRSASAPARPAPDQPLFVPDF